MNRAHVIDSEKELSVLNAKPDASFVLDEEDWEEAIDDSGVDCDIMCHSQWRSSFPSPGDD